jgi:hypothetical protein
MLHFAAQCKKIKRIERSPKSVNETICDMWMKTTGDICPKFDTSIR